MYSTRKLNQLKEELKKRVASCSGRKADLVERLEAYDRNFNFTDKSYSPEPVQGEVMIIPKDDFYKDINSNTPLPPLNKHQIQEYFGEGIINKDKYNERIRNLVLNCTGSTMPLRQLYKPANPYAIEWDHGSYSVSLKDKILKSLYLKNVTLEDIENIERDTRMQSQNENWYLYRKNRLTASNFHTICHLSFQNMPSFAKNIMSRRSVSTRATNHGKISEKVALKQYCDKYALDVKECGLFINKEKPYLGASPDGLLGNNTIIEVKCPYSTWYGSINPVNVPYLCLENGELQIKKTHPYYYQIQGQLFCTNREFCNLIIYTYKDLQVVYITKDERFIAEMVKKLDLFYKNYFEEAVLNKYLYKYYAEIIKP
ncbi:unnamed protein product [Parnassius apollo]|uniref:(apollo) hypothetical protein n=1 Tax=Parnassius apollo TaxID=110799 RepID=A0A8S3YE76_PARAO|nr:unnamed protein product [Parnassius apollo]